MTTTEYFILFPALEDDDGLQLIERTVSTLLLTTSPSFLSVLQ